MAYLEQQKPFFDFMFERYWRVDLRGATRPKPSKPVVFVANLSGILPWDAMMLAHAIGRGRPTAARPRFLVQDRVLALPLRWPKMMPQLRKHNLPGLVACDRVARTSMNCLRNNVVSSRFQRAKSSRLTPTGIAIRLRRSWIRVRCLRRPRRVAQSCRLASWGRKTRPLGSVTSTPVFPLLGPLGLLPLPAKWVISLGEPVPARTVVEHAETETALELNGVLRARIQALVESGLESRSSTWA